MLKKAKFIYALLLLLLLAGPEAASQSKFKETIRSIFRKQEPQVAYEIPVHLLMPKDKLWNISFSEITGNTLDELYGDIYSEIGYVPEIGIPVPDKGIRYEGSFNIAEYTREIQREEDDDDEEDIDYSDTPEEYNIWTNASINPYNVKLSEMTDTVRIDVSSYTSPGYKYVTSEFGGRWGRLHAGIDLKVFIGDTIRSAFENGVVRISKFNKRGYGYYVVVRHENGLETLYGHMSKILVEEGQHVKAGQAVGLGGSTGRSTGPHLHFELRYLGNPINPRDAIDFNTGKINDKTLVLTRNNFRYQNQKFSKKSKGRKGTASKGNGKKSKGSAKNAKGAKTVTVRKGDTLGAIARRNGTTVAKIQRLNGLKGTLIRAGQKLRVR